jgi:hypothetical protein
MQEDAKEEYGTLIAKKSERLITALYLVTDLMGDFEPIKRSMRTNAVSLLSSMNSLAQREVKDKVTEFKVSLRSVTEIISLLHVATTTGLVSDMNGTILTEGFRSLQLVLEKKQPILTKEMLKVDNESSLSNDNNLSSAITSTSYDALTPLTLARMHEGGHDKQVHPSKELPSQVSTTQQADFSNKGQNKQRDNFIVNKVEYIKHTSNVPLASSFQMKKQSRRDQILALFVKGVDVSIKDIASRIKGCSEKTIQRELNSLLYDRLIDRIGEKRWSRYILK